MKPVQTQVETVVAQVFDRLPALMGFSVEELETGPQDPVQMHLERELVLSNVETFPWTCHTGELLGEIATPLLELMDEEPEARELLRGRTFARRMQ